MSEEVPDCRREGHSHDIPVFHEEATGEAIWTRRFVVLDGEKNLFDFFIKEGLFACLVTAAEILFMKRWGTCRAMVLLGAFRMPLKYSYSMLPISLGFDYVFLVSSFSS